MTTQLVLQALMLAIGYFGVSKLVAIEHRKYGIAVCFVVNILLIMLQSYISPWPFGVPIMLSSYVALGVWCKAVYKPDQPSNS
jgi:hypothetical protein